MHELKSGRELARTLLLSLVDRELNPSGTDHSPTALPGNAVASLPGTPFSTSRYLDVPMH